eukprot:UN28964
MILLDDHVSVPQYECTGIVKYKGKLQGKPGIWYGIALDDKLGKNNGTINGTYYFKCRAGYGIFTRGKK